MSLLELILIVLIAAATSAPLLHGRGRSMLAVATATIMVVAVAIFHASAKPRVIDVTDEVPPQVAGREGEKYVSSKTCRSCHPGEYESWHSSYHRTMTQLATTETVIAPFDGVTLASRGRTYELERRGDEFWVRMADPDWEALRQRSGERLDQIDDPPIVDLRVFMTTGSHHMQGYWVKSRFGNMMRQIPWYYLIEERRWVPREDVFMQPENDARHFSTWNDTCLHCHSVGGRPRMDIASGTGIPDSVVAEFGIACESCHGPASRHIEKHRNPLTRYQARHSPEADDSIVNPARLAHDRSSEVCGSCHGFSRVKKPRNYVVNGTPFRPGDDLSIPFEIVRYDPSLDEKARDIFWADGTCRTGGDEFNALSQSACYLRGEISCLSCHSMHDSDPNDQLSRIMVEDETCLRCHESYRDRIEEHTHHPVSSSGSRCYNCHMPFTSYALLTAMRSHRIDNPSVEASVRSGRPNACNLCHLDQTLDWSAEHLHRWYDVPVPEMSDDQKTIAASLLWLYQGDAVQRAVASWNMGWQDARAASGDDWIAPHLAISLDDPYATVRFVGARALRGLPGMEDLKFDYIGSTSHRADAVKDARQRWKERGGASPRENHARLLLSLPDQIQVETIDRLLRSRNLRSLKVAE